LSLHPDEVLRLTTNDPVPDPGGLNSCGSGGSGSPTLLRANPKLKNPLQINGERKSKNWIQYFRDKFVFRRYFMNTINMLASGGSESGGGEDIS
jgi:hypothetical protein